MQLWFFNFCVYSLQLAILILAGGLMVAATRLRLPRALLIYLQILLALGLLLPAVEPWRPVALAEQSPVQAGGRIIQAASVRIEAAITGTAHAAPALSIYDLVALVLLAGVLFRLLWLAAGLIRLRRSCRNARPLGPHSSVDEFKAELEVSPAVLVSDRVSSPVAFGWRGPRIMLPAKLLRMDKARQRVILCHEFLHVRRCDWLWHVGEEILRALFWFHPAVLWIIAQIRLAREQVVDQEVVILTGSRRDYLDALFEIASASAGQPFTLAPLFLSERHLKRRVALILKEVAMSRKKMIFALSASFGALLLAGALAAALLPLRTSADQPQSSSAAPSRGGHPAGVNGVEVERQAAEAMKRAKIAQQAAAKINTAGIQRQAAQALKQAMEQAEQAASKIDYAKVREQIQQAAEKLNSPGVQRQLKQAMEQAEQAASKIDYAKIRQQIEQANEQVQAAEKEAAQTQENLEEQEQQLQRQRQNLEKQRQELEQQRQALEKQRQELQDQRQVPERQRQELRQCKPPKPSPPESAPASPAQPPSALPQAPAAPAAGGPGAPAGAKPVPKLVHQVEPTYPAAAKAAHIEGTVQLRVTVSPQGRVVGVKVVSGQPLLADASVHVVRQWRFEPPGKTAKVRVQTTFHVY